MVFGVFVVLFAIIVAVGIGLLISSIHTYHPSKPRHIVKPDLDEFESVAAHVTSPEFKAGAAAIVNQPKNAIYSDLHGWSAIHMCQTHGLFSESQTQALAFNLTYEEQFNSDEAFQQNQCFYTFPDLRWYSDPDNGAKRRFVVMCFNSRNWDSCPEFGVLAAWSDGETGFFTFKEANERYGISRDEWDDPARKLFGKKPPFHRTYE